MKHDEGKQGGTQPKIMLNVHYQEGVDDQTADMLADAAVSACLNEEKIVIPEGTDGEVEIEVYVDNMYNILVVYGDTKVGMSATMIGVGGYRPRRLRDTFGDFLANIFGGGTTRGGSIHGVIVVDGSLIDAIEQMFEASSDSGNEETTTPVS